MITVGGDAVYRALNLDDECLILLPAPSWNGENLQAYFCYFFSNGTRVPTYPFLQVERYPSSGTWEPPRAGGVNAFPSQPTLKARHCPLRDDSGNTGMVYFTRQDWAVGIYNATPNPCDAFLLSPKSLIHDPTLARLL